MKSVDVSIIIVNFNTKKLVLECIASVKKNTKTIKYEIIVVDNGSTEQFPESKSYQLIANSTNSGFARANNQGIEVAKGKYVMLLNSDAVVKDDAIEKVYEFAEDHEDAGVVVPKLINTDKTDQASVFRFPTIGRAIKQYWLGEKGILNKYIPESETVEAAVMAAFLITPVALKKVGKLDEKYFLYYEDIDYCLRVSKARLKVYYLAGVEVMHIHGASGGMNKLLVESAKKYHGILGYYIFTFVLWSGQKLGRMMG